MRRICALNYDEKMPVGMGHPDAEGNALLRQLGVVNVSSTHGPASQPASRLIISTLLRYPSSVTGIVVSG